MPASGASSPVWCGPCHDHLCAGRLQQLLRLLRAGVPSSTRRPSHRCPVVERRLHRRTERRSQGARGQDGAAGVPGRGPHQAARHRDQPFLEGTTLRPLAVGGPVAPDQQHQAYRARGAESVGPDLPGRAGVQTGWHDDARPRRRRRCAAIAVRAARSEGRQAHRGLRYHQRPAGATGVQFSMGRVAYLFALCPVAGFAACL